MLGQGRNVSVQYICVPKKELAEVLGGLISILEPSSSTFITYYWCYYSRHSAFCGEKHALLPKLARLRRAARPSGESNCSATTVHRTLTWYDFLLMYRTVDKLV